MGSNQEILDRLAELGQQFATLNATVCERCKAEEKRVSNLETTVYAKDGLRDQVVKLRTVIALVVFASPLIFGAINYAVSLAIRHAAG